MTDTRPPASPAVQGRCPACRGDSLFLAGGGYVICRRLDCPDPEAATGLLEQVAQVPGRAARLAAFTRDDFELR